MIRNMIVFLANAWSPVYAGREWPRHVWLDALRRSRSGQRLTLLLTDDQWDCCFNTTPICGATPSEVVPANMQYINRVLADRQPEIVVTCGQQAEKAVLPLWHGPALVLPHPAYRLLTDKLYVMARQFLNLGFTGRKALRQRPDGIIDIIRL